MKGLKHGVVGQLPLPQHEPMLCWLCYLLMIQYAKKVALQHVHSCVHVCAQHAGSQVLHYKAATPAQGRTYIIG